MYILLIMEMHLCYSMIHSNILLYVLHWTQNIYINIFVGRLKCLYGCLNSVSSSLVDKAIQVGPQIRAPVVGCD